MNVNNSLQGMQQLFSSQDVAGPASHTNASSAQTTQMDQGSDRTTLSSAASLAAAAAADSDVRMDKVTSIQQALASGTYNVPASAVAGSMIDSMLGK